MDKRPKDEKRYEIRAPEPTSSPKEQVDEVGQGYDDIIGGFGKYQFLIFMFKILIGITSAFNNLGVTFFAPTDFISFWCAQSPDQPISISRLDFRDSLVAGSSLRFDNSTYNLTSPHVHTLDHSNRSIATVTRDNLNNGFMDLMSGFLINDERRRRHSLNLDNDTPKNLRKECQFRSLNDGSLRNCLSYKYDTGIWMSTIIDEWDLVCDRSWFVSVTQSLYMAGFIIAYLIFGYLSDRFGRWNSLLIGASIEVLSGLGCAFASSITQFMIFRFLLGLGNAGRSASSYLIMIEWTGGSWRMHISTLGSIGWAIGYCIMPWITLFFLHFRHMQLFVCLYELIFVIWLLFLPESPRWLLTHRRYHEAYGVLLMAAKFNGLIKDEKSTSESTTQSSLYLSNLSNRSTIVQANGGKIPDSELPIESSVFLTNFNNNTQIPLTNGNISKMSRIHDANADIENEFGQQAGHRTLKPYTMREFDLKFQHLSRIIEAKEFTKKEDRLSMIDLFKWKNLRKYTFILAFAWAVNSFVYYGIALNVGNFGAKNLFVAFTYAGVTELPSIAFTIICMKFLPRKTTNIFLFSTIFFLCALQVPLKYYDCQWLQQVTMMLAKLFNSCSFTCILYQSMELFPTSIRQTAYSSCALAGRIGSILAPFIKELSQKTNNLVPPVIYAALSILEIIFIRHLPETQGTDLPDTLLEAEKFKGTDRRSSS